MSYFFARVATASQWQGYSTRAETFNSFSGSSSRIAIGFTGPPQLTWMPQPIVRRLRLTVWLSDLWQCPGQKGLRDELRRGQALCSVFLISPEHGNLSGYTAKSFPPWSPERSLRFELLFAEHTLGIPVSENPANSWRGLSRNDSSVVEVAAAVQASGPRNHRAQPWDFDGPPLGHSAELCPRPDGPLRLGIAVETVRQAWNSDPETHLLLLLEALATCSHTYPGTYRDACAP